MDHRGIPARIWKIVQCRSESGYHGVLSSDMLHLSPHGDEGNGMCYLDADVINIKDVINRCLS
jgi:hypothetical protein